MFYTEDIAVLELNATIKLSDYIMPVCLDWGGKLELYRNPLIFGTVWIFFFFNVTLTTLDRFQSLRLYACDNLLSFYSY